MRKLIARIGLRAVLPAMLAALCAAPACAGGTVKVKWYVNAIVSMTLTPNYATPFGTVPASFTATPAPVPGPGSVGCQTYGCPVDFGAVEAGKDYLYRNAVQLAVSSNDPSGFRLYGEGTADFSDGGTNTMTLNQTLYWLPSSPSNTGYSAAYPFEVTSGTVTPGSPPTITYATFPAPIETVAVASADVDQDYELKVPVTAATGSTVDYSVWIVYTVVPS